MTHQAFTGAEAQNRTARPLLRWGAGDASATNGESDTSEVPPRK